MPTLNLFRCIAAAMLAVSSLAYGWQSPPPDLILYHGVILTGEGLDKGKTETVSALAISDGKVLLTGSDIAVKALAGPKTRMRNLHGTFVMPGFNDAHTHLGGAGQTKLNVDLTGSSSLAEMLQRVKAKAEQESTGHWLTGGGWDHTLWADKTLPTRQDLDRVTGDHPAILERIDGHIAIANSAALKAAGITGKTKALPGGAIDLDAQGRPTGILRDTAMEAAERVIPPPTTEERRHGLELAIADAVSHGVTSVQDFSEWDDFLVFEALEREGRLRVRVSEWLTFTDPIETLKAHRAHHDAHDPMLHTGMLKGFMDGSLGSRTAALKAPYTDEPANSGLPRYEQTKLNAMAIEREKAGFQLGFHAIGDRATAMALEAFAQPVPNASAAASTHDGRNRVEHAQVVDPADIPRFAQLGVIASMQPNHLLTDMNWAEERLGKERAAYSYACKAFLDAGVLLAFGTDYPVEPVTPFRGLYAAVTRENEAGTKSYFPENKLTRAQALYAYTQGSAYAEFAEGYKGKLARGFVADYVVLDRDLLTVPAPEILKTRVLETVVAGKTVFTAEEHTQR
ncbi:MAG TPA: amidohydrolase [Acidobacteriaceae bacterium]|nr:amidohydrolase [Acidobacteriaceae bacterium]